MNTSVSELIGSSHLAAIADDALKDEDNAAWVMELEPEIRCAWIERIGWIRLADRLAESDLLGAESGQFQSFCDAWRWLMVTGQVQPVGAYQAVFHAMHDHWFKQPSELIAQRSIQSWNQYLSAIAQYHQENLIFEDLHQFEQMMEGLAASFFQVLPFLEAHQWRIAGYFGVVDQFYNILRDLHEDAKQGICYLPTEVLDRFGVSRDEILDLRAYENPGYRSMMQFWIYDYLPKLYRRAYPFILASDLHPSWQMLRDWSLNRYRRIERILRRCDYDYVRFSSVYWREVRRDLVLMLPGRFGAVAARSSGAFCDQTRKLVQLANSKASLEQYHCG